MNSKKKADLNMNFKEFSPFYDNVFAVAKRDENILRIVEKEIDKQKMVCYSQLTAAQRIVEKDLFDLRLAKRKISQEKQIREARSESDSNYRLEDFAREKIRPKNKETDTDIVTELTLPCILITTAGLLTVTHNSEQQDVKGGEDGRKPRRPVRYSMPESSNLSLFKNSRHSMSHSARQTGAGLRETERSPSQEDPKTEVGMKARRPVRYSMPESKNASLFNYSRPMMSHSARQTGAGFREARKSSQEDTKKEAGVGMKPRRPERYSMQESKNLSLFNYSISPRLSPSAGLTDGDLKTQSRSLNCRSPCLMQAQNTFDGQF